MSQFKNQEELQEYLAKIRRTVSESEALIASARLRMEETDRQLAENGLTREQILAWHPTKDQRLAVNEALRARGLPPLEEDETETNFDAATARLRARQQMPMENETPQEATGGDGGADVTEERQRKFDKFMQKYRI